MPVKHFPQWRRSVGSETIYNFYLQNDDDVEARHCLRRRTIISMEPRDDEHVELEKNNALTQHAAS